MDSLLSTSPITPATSIVPPSTPPLQQQHQDEIIEEQESPLLNSLQLSEKEQSYINEINTAPRTPTFTPNRTFISHKHTNSVPAYKFPSLRNFQLQSSTPVTRPCTPSTPSSEVLDPGMKINQVPHSGVSKASGNRYSVYVQNEDFEIYRPPPRRGKWWIGHGKSNSFGEKGLGFLKSHKKSRSDFNP